MIEEIINKVPDDKKELYNQLRQTILDHLPVDFEEGLSYGMVGYYVPHHIYPAGYHCNPKLPLPFMSIAAQKNSVNFYHMGLYADANLYQWFIESYKNFSTKKLDIGKSCMRFKNINDVPFELIGQLVSKITVQNWIETYEINYKK